MRGDDMAELQVVRNKMQVATVVASAAIDTLQIDYLLRPLAR